MARYILRWMVYETVFLATHYNIYHLLEYTCGEVGSDENIIICARLSGEIHFGRHFQQDPAQDNSLSLGCVVTILGLTMHWVGETVT